FVCVYIVWNTFDVSNLKSFEKLNYEKWSLGVSNMYEEKHYKYRLTFNAYKRHLNFTLLLRSNLEFFSIGFKTPQNTNILQTNLLTGKIKDDKLSRIDGYIYEGIFGGVLYSHKEKRRYYIQPIHTLGVDVSYSNYYGGTTYGAYQAMTRIAEASYILQNIQVTDSSLSPEGYKIRVQKIRANSSNSSVPTMFNDNILNADKVMLEFASQDFRDYCLAFLFLSKPFQEGVAGAAYAARLDIGSGGICSERFYYDIGGSADLLNLNTLMITNIFYDQPMYPFQETRNLLHELGHSFGSGHDSSTISECTPSVSEGGPYLMYPTTPNIVLKNTYLFSKCSRTNMETILRAKSDNCLRESENLCGNSILDPGEQCDCGDFDPFCQDKCCNPPSSSNQCKLINGATCSPKQGKCCDSNKCSFNARGMICNEETTCSHFSYCTYTALV
ncbi:hypothetical protein HZS_8105, partial [Henneguya salminicola]